MLYEITKIKKYKKYMILTIKNDRKLSIRVIMIPRNYYNNNLSIGDFIDIKELLNNIDINI